MPNFSTIAEPLTNLTKKGKPNKINWNSNLENSYSELKGIITSQPVLKLPNFAKTFHVRTDASETGLGSILMQEYDGELFPISYASKKLTEQERTVNSAADFLSRIL